MLDLIITLKHLLKLVSRNTCATVSDCNLQVASIDILSRKREKTRCIIMGYNIKAELNLTSIRSELQRIGQEVEAYLIQLIIVNPYIDRVLETISLERDSLLFCIHPEDISKVGKLGNDINLPYRKFQCIILQLIEVKLLVYKPEHTMDIALHDIKQSLALRREIRRLGQLSHRARDHCQRRTELMSNVCKEVHVHLVDPSFLLFLLLSLDLLHLFSSYLAPGLEYQVDSTCSNEHIYDERPP